jgi:hypothetical protein
MRAALALLLAAAAPAAALPAAAAAAAVPTRACARGTPWMSGAGIAGHGAQTRISLRPTTRARIAGNPAARRIWSDLRTRCLRTTLPSLTAGQRDSLYKQLYCHALYGRVAASWDGGPTWDLEASRPDVGWTAALRVADRCNWR